MRLGNLAVLASCVAPHASRRQRGPVALRPCLLAGLRFGSPLPYAYFYGLYMSQRGYACWCLRTSLSFKKSRSPRHWFRWRAERTGLETCAFCPQRHQSLTLTTANCCGLKVARLTEGSLTVTSSRLKLFMTSDTPADLALASINRQATDRHRRLWFPITDAKRTSYRPQGVQALFRDYRTSQFDPDFSSQRCP